MDDAIVDRARGALIGLAVGDALGTTLEFSQRDRLPHHTEISGGGPFRLEAGQWTDDTSMALALADSLIQCGKFDAFDLMKRFVSWWREGEYSCTGRCFDIGGTTSDALARFERTGQPFAGSAAETSAGNGSLMRLAPVVLFAFDDAALTAQLAVDQSRTTHAAVQATEACAYFAELLRRAMAGVPKAEVLAPSSWRGHEALQSIARGDWRARTRDEIRSSGYVIDTLEAALWAVEKTDSFEDALILAVNLADDADSVGAVTGQLAGGFIRGERYSGAMERQDRVARKDKIFRRKFIEYKQPDKRQKFMIENERYNDQIEKRKKDFLARYNVEGSIDEQIKKALSEAWGAAVGRNLLYARDCLPNAPIRRKLRGEWEESVKKLAFKTMNSDEYEKAFMGLKEQINNKFNDSLCEGGFRVSHAQKGLSVYMKHLWCLNKICEPPQCPIDRTILKQLAKLMKLGENDRFRQFRDLCWTQINTLEAHRDIIFEIKKVCGEQSIACWELDFFSA